MSATLGAALIGLIGGLALVWVGLVAVLWFTRSADLPARELMRLLPDTVRLVSRLARDPTVPRGVRIRLWLLLAYLLLPFDLVPDFIPVIGLVDDALVIALVLRSVVRRAGVAAVERHWPGSPEGLATIERVAARRVDS